MTENHSDLKAVRSHENNISCYIQPGWICAETCTMQKHRRMCVGGEIKKQSKKNPKHQSQTNNKKIIIIKKNFKGKKKEKQETKPLQRKFYQKHNQQGKKRDNGTCF